MKKLNKTANGILVLWALLFACPVYTQHLEVTYTETVKMADVPQEEVDPEMLEQIKNANKQTRQLSYSGGKSIYREIPAEPGVPGDQEVRRVFIRNGESVIAIYKNQENKQFVKEVNLFMRPFIIRTGGVEYNWKIEPEQKQIGSYMCQKASGILDTIPVVAWYCSQIPVSDGPDVFWGLPGLILEVNAGDNAKVITAGKISFSEKAIAIDPPDKGNEVTEAEFKSIKAKKMAEMGRSNGGSHQHMQMIRMQ